MNCIFAYRCVSSGACSLVVQWACKSLINCFGILVADRQILYKHITQLCCGSLAKPKLSSSKPVAKEAGVSAQSGPWGAAVSSNFAHLFAQGFISSFIIQSSENEYLPCQLNWGHLSGRLCSVLGGLMGERAELYVRWWSAFCAIRGDRDTWVNSGHPELCG